MDTIVVTGGAGFIGSNLIAAIREDDDLADVEVIVVDRFGCGDKWRNLGKRPRLRCVAPERGFEVLEAAAERISAVVHLGAISSTVEPDVDLILETNFALSERLWDWCTRRGVRLIYASSAATYGDGAAGFDDAGDLARLRPLNAYGWSKHMFDQQAVARAERGERPPQWAGLKLFNVYGPNEYHKGRMQSAVAHIADSVGSGQPARLFRSHRDGIPDGGQRRDFVHVDDCVAVILWLLRTPGVNGLLNVGTGHARSFLELAHAVFAALQRPPQIEFVDVPADIRANYQYFTEARIERLRAAGYDRPFCDLEEGVERYVRRYLAATDPYR